MDKVLVEIIGPNEIIPRGCSVGQPDGRGSPEHTRWLVDNGFRWVYREMEHDDDCPLCPRGGHTA